MIITWHYKLKLTLGCIQITLFRWHLCTCRNLKRVQIHLCFDKDDKSCSNSSILGTASLRLPRETPEFHLEQKRKKKAETSACFHTSGLWKLFQTLQALYCGLWTTVYIYCNVRTGTNRNLFRGYSTELNITINV